MDDARIKNLEDRMNALEQKQEKFEQRIDVVEDEQSAYELLQINIEKRVNTIEQQMLVHQEALLGFLGSLDKKQDKMLDAINIINNTLAGLPCHMEECKIEEDQK